MLPQIFYILYGAGRALNESNRLKTVAVCEQCATEQPKGSKFCRKCGCKSLLGAGDFDNLKRQRRDDELKDLEQRQRRNLAILRIQTFSRHTFCTRCGVHFEDSCAFCTQCGANIAKHFMPDHLIFPLISKEFPKIVRTQQDYQVLKSSSPESGVTRRSLSLLGMKILDPAPISSTTNFLILFVIAAIVGLFVFFTHLNTYDPPKVSYDPPKDREKSHTKHAKIAARVASAPTPEPIVLNITPQATPPVAKLRPPTPLPSPASDRLSAHFEPPAPPVTPQYATVADATKVALQRYPDLGVAGSKLNTAFIARYNVYQATRPDYFADTSWPLNLAKELTQPSSTPIEVRNNGVQNSVKK